MSRPLYLFLVLIFCLTWSSAFPTAKLAITVAPPLLFLGVRFLIAATILVGAALIFRRRRTDGTHRPVPWLTLMALGVVNFAFYQGMLYLAMRTVSGGLATIITSLNPVLVACLAVPFLGERLIWRKLGGLLLGFAGAAFVVRNRVAIGEDLPGIGLAFIGMFSLTIGTLLTKRLQPGLDLFLLTGVQQAGAGMTLLALGGLRGEQFSEFVIGLLLLKTMLWFVFVVSIASFLLWFFLLRRGSAASASSLHFLMPPLGLIMSWVLLGERLQPLDLVGVVPVALGIWLATSEPISTRVVKR